MTEKAGRYDDDEAPVYEHPVLGYRTRSGDWPDQARATYHLFEDAIAECRWRDAASLAEHTIFEAKEPHELYIEWAAEIRNAIVETGVRASVVAEDEAELLKSLHWDDGTDFDAEAGWQAANTHMRNAVAACADHDGLRAISELEDSRTIWLATHDRKCDWVQGLIAIAVKHLGEMRIGDLWDRVMAPIFASYHRYDTDVRPWPESAELLMRVTVDSLRGHLTGPTRHGELTYLEERGRRGFRFEPCGAGGRNFTSDDAPPFPVTGRGYDWSWNTKGVCLYCVHCCAVSERNPIQRYGYPARVIEPPFRNEDGSRDFCTWWVYDDPRDVPEEVYARTGNSKPSEIGGAATARRAATMKSTDDS